jgi:carbamoyl-phosphate synthase/aspartate carbamoyltransferase/dihydroorotase
MEETTGDLLVTEQDDLESIFSNWSGKQPIPVHASGRTLQNAIALAKKYNKRLHACHVATEEGILKIKKAKEDGIKVTCEVTPHHLFLTEDDLPRLGPFGMMKPPLATKRDQQALWDNLNIIDALASDHASHTNGEKINSPKPPAGVTGLETAIPLMLTAVKEGRLSMEKLIELIYVNPRKIFNIPETPDTYTEVDLDDSHIIDSKNLYTKAKWTPFDGAKVTGRIRKVVLRGNVVFDGENIMHPALGKVIYPR